MASNSMPARLVGLNGKTFETYVAKPAPVVIRKHARLWESQGGWGGGELEITASSPVIHFKLIGVEPAPSKYEQDRATYAQISADEAIAIKTAHETAILIQQQAVAKLVAPQQPAKPSQPYNSWDPLSIADKSWTQITTNGANIALDQYAPVSPTNVTVPKVAEKPPKPKPAPQPSIPAPVKRQRRMMGDPNA